MPTGHEVLKDFLARREGFVFGGSARNLDYVRKTLSAVIRFWDIANIPRMGVIACERKVMGLWKEWQGINKRKSRNSATELKTRERYIHNLNCVLDLSPSDWKEQIRKSMLTNNPC